MQVTDPSDAESNKAKRTSAGGERKFRKAQCREGGMRRRIVAES
jgi:hypothetical protein